MIVADITSHSAAHGYCERQKHTRAMKYLLALCVVIAAVLGEDKYTDKYDNINIDEILDNKRLLLAYTDCVLDKGKCSSEGTVLKDNLQDAIQNGCAKCTEKQEENATKIFNRLINNEKAIWTELTDKFDPEGVWRKKYEDKAKQLGIKF